MESELGSNKTYIERVLIAIGFVVLAVLLLALIYFTFDVVLLIFASILIAVFLRGLANTLGRFVKLKDSLRVLIVAVLLLLILAGAIVGLAPSVAEQADHLRIELPKSLEAARIYITQFSWGRAIIEQLPDLNSIWANIMSSGFLSRVGGIFSSTLGAIGNFAIVVLLAIYFAIEPDFYAKGFAKLFPIPKRQRVFEVLAAINDTLGRWLIGKAASMIFIGVLTWILLSILGIPLALTLGLIAGLLSFIPNFGPIISAVPAVLIAFIESPITAVYVIGIYVVVQVVEGNIVTPIIERETVELPPGITVIFQLAMTVLVGGLGLLLATPLLAVIMVVIQMVYVEDILGDRETEINENVGEETIKDEGKHLLDSDDR